LTREAGAPGSEVGQEVGRRLGWPVYDRELIERIAKEMGLRASLLESVDEKSKSILLESLDAMGLGKIVTEPKFVKLLVETVVSLGLHGRCVIVGRGAAHILPAQSTLRVRVVAAKEDRARAVQQQLKLSAADAQRWVEDTDRERIRFVQDHFYKDPTDPARYDLVLNASRWSVIQCADFIMAAMKELEKTR
jgi:cytidylate kinase